MFKWHKFGQVFNLKNADRPNWMFEQAQNPYVVEMKGFIRIYFNCRPKKDIEGKSTSYAGFVDLDKKDFFNVLNI